AFGRFIPAGLALSNKDVFLAWVEAIAAASTALSTGTTNGHPEVLLKIRTSTPRVANAGRRKATIPIACKMINAEPRRANPSSPTKRSPPTWRAHQVAAKKTTYPAISVANVQT